MRIQTMITAAAIAASATAASAATLDFEGVLASQGAVPGNTISGPGVTVTLGGSNATTLGLYDSSCRMNCTGGDDDLATGAGITAPPINAGADTPDENFILISSEGSGPTFGDRVGSPDFIFTYDTPSFIDEFVLIDIDENPNRVTARFDFADGSSSAFDGTNATSVINAGVDNSYSVFDIAMIDAAFVKPVNAFTIEFNSISGGVASVSATPVPVPAALPLLAGGLGLLGWVSRRRRAA